MAYKSDIEIAQETPMLHIREIAKTELLFTAAHVVVCSGKAQAFIESMQPYLYGDSDMDTALSIARGKLEIFAAEHSA